MDAVPVVWSRRAESRARSAGLINDLHVYDSVNIRWTELTDAVFGTLPDPRDGHGFTTAGGKLYVHGGYGVTGARPG